MAKNNIIKLSTPQIETKSTDVAIGDVIAKLESGEWAVDPDFQRNYVWTKKDECYLIETIILGYGIPTFFAYEVMENGKIKTYFEDGQQRLTAIRKFMCGDSVSAKTGKRKGKFTLKYLETLDELNGKSWDDLGKITFVDGDGSVIDMQHRIKSYNITICKLPKDAPEGSPQEQYTRLNTSGVKLSHAAIRRNKYMSDYYKFTKYLSEKKEFLEIIGNNGSGAKKQAQANESLVHLWGWLFENRIYRNGSADAYVTNPNNPRSAVDNHLNEFTPSKKNDKDVVKKIFTEELKNDMEAAFDKATKLMKCVFGAETFRKPTILTHDDKAWEYKYTDESKTSIEFGPFNPAFYECLMYLFSFADEQSVIDNAGGIKNAIYAAVKNDKEFHESVHNRVRTKASAIVRFPGFHRILKDQGVKFSGI